MEDTEEYEGNYHPPLREENTPQNRQKYAQVPKMHAYSRIPPPSQAAIESAIRGYEKMRESSPSLVEDFRQAFEAWKATWFGGFSSNAEDRCCVKEFDILMDMGPQIRPLVLYALLDPGNFTAIFLYNVLEKNKKYKIYPWDTLNFLTLQRHSNLIVDLNQDREWELA